MPESSNSHVLIIGGGVTGLLIAHGLQKADIQYTLFESEDEGRWRSKEWTMGIHWGLPLLESLLPPELAARIGTDGSVDASLDWTQKPNNGAYICDGVNGELLKDLTPEGRNVRVSRRRLRKLCQEGVEIQWGHALQDVKCNDNNHTVTATFTNGKGYTGTLLIGADGPRSTVRQFLFAHDPATGQARNLEDIVGHSMAVSYDAETAKHVRSAHPVWCIAISPELFVFQSTQEVPDPDRPENWKFFFFPCWLGERDQSLDNDGRVKALKDRAGKLAEVLCPQFGGNIAVSRSLIQHHSAFPHSHVGYSG